MASISEIENLLEVGNVKKSLEKKDYKTRKAILQYLVRFGSMSEPENDRYEYEDEGDKDLLISSGHWEKRPKLTMLAHLGTADNPSYLASIKRSYDVYLPKSPDSFRIMQWNILADALANGADNFFERTPTTLRWTIRRWKIMNEIRYRAPDIICLMEVDHFIFFDKILTDLGMKSIFAPKPDSPCCYNPHNNGPDGCALFINTAKFEVLFLKSFRLTFCSVPTNQVAVFCKLMMKENGREFYVACTHLKARTNRPVFAEMREAQCRILLEKIRSYEPNGPVPLILAGDLNGSPTERLHQVLKDAGLKSAYSPLPPFTTWTRRDNGEELRDVLDYIYYTDDAFQVERILKTPADSDIGDERLPNDFYPSDHLSLVADMRFQPH